MKRPFQLLAIIGVSACADPASLRVRVMSRAAGVDRVELRAGHSAGTWEIIDCRLAAGGASEGRCPFAGGTGQWGGETEISFVLYGSPGSEIALEANGWAKETVIAETSTSVSLPWLAGDSDEIELALKGRTEVHRQCETTLGSISPERNPNGTALLVHRFGAEASPLIVAAVRGAAYKVRYVAGSRGDEHCELDVDPKLAWGCPVRAGAMAIGRVDRSPDSEKVFATCDFPGQGQGQGMMDPVTVLRVLAFENSTPEIRRKIEPDDYLVSTKASDVSAPVLVSLEPGQPQKVVALHAKPEVNGEQPLELVIMSGPQKWDSRRELVPLPLRLAKSPDGMTQPVEFAPVVVPMGGPNAHERLAIAGYDPPKLVTYSKSEGVRELDHDPKRPLFAPAAIYRPERSTSWVVTIHPPAYQGGRWRLFEADVLGPRPEPPIDLLLPFAPSTLVRPAIGDVRGDGSPPMYVVGRNKQLQLVSRSPGGRSETVGLPAEIPVSTPATFGVLLANLDGQPGSEIIFHDPGGRIHAVHATGRPLPGWPIETGVPGPEARLALGDLDRDGSLEVVVLSGTKLAVYSLGPGSYDPNGLPWPSAARDSRLTATHLGESDPMR